MTLLKSELKMTWKMFLIWTVCVAGMCFGCILMYSSMDETVTQMADMFSKMGALTKVFGMDRISIGTLEGYFAIEVAMMHNIGGAVFAAILANSILSKEESGHTAEFLCTLPMKRSHIAGIKYMVVVLEVMAFNILSVLLYVMGFFCMGETVNQKNMLLYFAASVVLQLEIGGICFVISSFQKKNQVTGGIGLTVLLFCMDLMCRIVPAIKNLKYVTPFYYANATDIFTAGKIEQPLFAIGVVILAAAPGLGICHYVRKDIAA